MVAKSKRADTSIDGLEKRAKRFQRWSKLGLVFALALAMPVVLIGLSSLAFAPALTVGLGGLIFVSTMAAQFLESRSQLLGITVSSLKSASERESAVNQIVTKVDSMAGPPAEPEFIEVAEVTISEVGIQADPDQPRPTGMTVATPPATNSDEGNCRSAVSTR